MSSSLIFYVKSKDYEHPIEIASFNRSTEIYQYFVDYLNITETFTKLSVTDIRAIQEILYTDIYRNKARLETYDKYAHMNVDLVEEVIGIKEYLGQLTKAKFYIDFITLMIDEASNRYSRSSEIYCAIR